MKVLPGAWVAISMLAITGVLNAAADELGLVAHWPLDEGAGTVARDTSGNGNGNDGKVLGAQWVKVPGGHGLEFDGLNSYVDCGKPQVALAVYPRPGNAQETFLLDQVRFLIDDCGLDGFYIDEFSQAWGGSIRDYGGWDGTSVDIDPATGKIAGKWIDCSLTGISSRVKILNAGLARGKNVNCNTWSTSAAEQALPAQRFWEMQQYANPSGFVPGKKPPFVYEMSEGLLGSPIGLGAIESKDKPLGEGLMLSLIFYLRHGLLYYHYSYPELPENGPGNGEYGPINHSFPFTPVALHEGWMEGKERTITCLSGVYLWNRKTRPVVRVFGLDGREQTGKAALKQTKKGWSVELKLADWAEICIISADGHAIAARVEHK